MSTMQAFFGQYFGMLLGLVALAVVLTLFIFRRRWFDRGYRKGSAADPDRVRRENAPDDWSRNR